ncbi:F-box protein SKIP2 isoform X1 [Monomorium pharaonis]|uniref:F-box protein SKIP2 isoform X1 n=2 Tax=Monomorium pharaonis TaxID=307658 RepID=UPI00063FC80E|nr:F-box protein SKIP2 isoform X1 [Monomorium pharaonis]
MDDTLEIDYAEMLHHISVVVSEDCQRTPLEMIDGVPIRKLFVSNLAERTTFKDLRNYFSTYGNVESCYLRRNQGKSNYAFVTFTKVTDAVTAMQDGSRKQIRLHNRDLRVMAADSWHQPDSMEQRLYNMGKESNKNSERKVTTEQYVPKYLQNDSENVSIHMLNDDCLRHIFLFLPIVDRVRIELVCKRWRDLSQDSWHMTKTLDLSPSTWGFLYTHTIHTALLRKILLKCGRFLTQINLNNPIHCLSQSTLTIIGKLCPNLTNIDVTALTVCASGIRTLANNCRNITKFNLGPSTYCCDNELKCLFKLNQNLEYLAISKNGILGKSLLCLPEKTIHTVILDNCNYLQDNHLSMALRKLENLKHLTINECVGIAKHTLEVVGQHCKNLRTLELDGDFPSAQTADMSYLIHLVNLQVLKITYNPKVSDDFLTDLVQHCQQLINIDITGCDNVTDAGLAAIATLEKLEKLIVSYMYQITDEGLKNMCGLRELECRGCLFSDRGVTMLIKSSPQLQLLDLSGCRNIKDTTLEVAKDACNTRANNVMLKMIVGGTAILAKKEIGQERLPPLLHIVNVDLSDFSSVSNMYLVDDLDSWYDGNSDYTEYSDYIEYSDYTEYSEDDYREPNELDNYLYNDLDS